MVHGIRLKYSQLHGSYFEGYVTNARKYRSNLTYSIEAHDIMHPTENYEAISGGGRPLPPDSMEYLLVSIGLTRNFIESCIK